VKKTCETSAKAVAGEDNYWEPIDPLGREGPGQMPKGQIGDTCESVNQGVHLVEESARLRTDTSGIRKKNHQD